MEPSAAVKVEERARRFVEPTADVDVERQARKLVKSTAAVKIGRVRVVAEPAVVVKAEASARSFRVSS